MSISLVRYLDGDNPRWGVVDGESVVPLPAEYAATADVLADGAKVARSQLADSAALRVPLAEVALLAPVPDARIFCQGANYRSHMVESGMDPDRPFNMLFTKSTASLAGPADEIVRPSHVKLLDYEVELGLVLGRAIAGPVTVTDDNLFDFVAGFVAAGAVVQGQELSDVLPRGAVSRDARSWGVRALA